MAITKGSRSLLFTWWVAVRPFAYTGSVLPVVAGSVLALDAGFPLQWGRFFLALLGVVCFHTAANLLNDYFDYRRGLDTVVNPGSGALVRGWLSGRQVFAGAWLCFATGTACGLALVWLAGWMVLSLGLIGAVLVVGYTRGGFCLKYAGMGDVAIFLAFGVLPVFGAFWVQTQVFSWMPVLWSVPIVSFTVAILHANNWRDIGSDPTVKCRTVASILGERASRAYYQILVLGPFLLVALYMLLALVFPVWFRVPTAVWLVFLALPMALRLALTDWRRYAWEFSGLDAKTAKLHLVFGLLVIVGFAV